MEQSLRAFGAILEAIRAILEASWMVLKPEALGELLGSKSEPKGHLTGVQEGPKLTSRDDLSSKWRNHKT